MKIMNRQWLLLRRKGII